MSLRPETTQLLAGLAGENLSEEEIQQLLLEAETRLRGSAFSTDEDTSGGQLLSVASNVASSSTIPQIPKLSSGTSLQSYVREEDDVATADTSRMVTDDQRKLSNALHPVEAAATAELKGKKKEKVTAGTEWFDLPKTDLSTSLKRDLQLLRMRSVLDPKRHYKKENGKAKVPEFSHVGTLVEGPTEFFSSRIAKKDRKRTFVDETLAVEESNGRFQDKYGHIQASKTSGKKGYYKGLQAKRTRGNKFG